MVSQFRHIICTTGFTMKVLIAIAALIAIAHGQESPDERRAAFVKDLWDAASENGCFARQTLQDAFGALDDNEDKQVTESEFNGVVSIGVGNKPSACLWGRSSAVGGNPITIPAGVDKIFNFWQPSGDCINEQTFKEKATGVLKDCRWPEDENSQ